MKDLNKKALILWAVSTLFFAFQFILRLVPAVAMDEIMVSYALDTIAFGTLTSAYYIGYAGLQIPFGIMLDRYNYRHVTLFAISLCVFGNYFFIISDNYTVLIISRFLIGSGSAVGFLGVSKVIKSLFDEKHHALMIGFSFTFGMMGAIVGTKPMAQVFAIYPFLDVLIYLNYVGIFIGVVVLCASWGEENKNYNYSEIANYDSILKVIQNPNILLVGFAGGFMVGSLEGFADLWSIKFFVQAYGFSKIDASSIIAYFFFGMCFGGPILAYFSAHYSSELVMINLSAVAMAVIFGIFFYYTTWQFEALAFLVFLLGIFSCYQVLVFSFVSKLVAGNLSGITIAITNCINMSLGVLFHKLISFIIQNSWLGTVDSTTGARIYDYYAFVLALSTIPLGCLIGCLCFIYLNHRLQKKTDIIF